LEEKLTSLVAIMTRWQRDLEAAANRASRLEGAFSVLLNSLEGWKSDTREVASRTEARVLKGLEVIDSRITHAVPAKVEPDTRKLEDAVRELHAEVAKLHELPNVGERLESQIIQTLERMRRDSTGAGAEGKTLGLALTVMLESMRSVKDDRQQEARNWARLGEGLSILDRRLQAIEEKMSAARPSPQAQSFESWEQLTDSLQRLEARLAENQESFGRKLESVQASSDENNATQLRYLAGLEELQATLVNRMKVLEATLSNPLDAQQWERLAKGLEFLDSKLAQSYDSVANRLDTAISTLTNTLDNRTAASQEANLKSAERIWRSLTGLEEKVTGSGEATRQSQERLEKAAGNLAGALEELRAITGARSGHTEKILMEALENLDGRFSQNLLAVSESLSSAIFALNKSTGEWRSELFNAAEESEERVVKEIVDARARLAGSLKAGLDALGRREERILALILGGGAAFPPVSEEQPKAPE
jgi:chromosome segregation ATPase